MVFEIPEPAWVAPEFGVDWQTAVEMAAESWQRPTVLQWTADVDHRGTHHRSERYDISEQARVGLPKYVLTGHGLDFMSGSVEFLKSYAAEHYDRMTRRQRWSSMNPQAALGDHCEPPLWLAGTSIVG